MRTNGQKTVGKRGRGFGPIEEIRWAEEMVGII
jgi:hypothetical protein